MKGFVFGLIVLLLSSGSALAGTDFFRVNHEGLVQIRGHSFLNLDAYTQSDFFREQGMRCGTKPPVIDAEARSLEKTVADCTTTLTTIQTEYWPSSITYIMPVWFHVIYASDGTGNISEAKIIEQIAVLNEDYGAISGTMGELGYNTRIQFELAGITRTQNDTWFLNDEENAYKPALAKDQSQYINIYTTMAGGYLGYAYYPQGSAGEWWDGIVLQHNAVGGRDNGFYIYDQGRTLVHEMGHYLGLYHTFEGGSSCSNSYSSGDLIVDTPAEETEHFDCIQTNTCGSPDPIHNYMNYTNDTCMNQFSSEQANRAVCSMINYRPSTYRQIMDDSGNPVMPPLLMPLLLSR